MMNTHAITIGGCDFASGLETSSPSKRYAGCRSTIYDTCVRSQSRSEQRALIPPHFGRGFMRRSQFFLRYLGLPAPPHNTGEWLQVKEEGLSLCTNGAVFQDGNGAFTKAREALLGYYPDDIWRKKIASWCALFSQYGQYNLPRATARDDQPLVHHLIGVWMGATARLTHLLARRYCPFYKWQFRNLRRLGTVGHTVLSHLIRFSSTRSSNIQAEIVNEVAQTVVTELQRHKLITGERSDLKDCIAEIESRITPNLLHSMPLIVDW